MLNISTALLILCIKHERGGKSFSSKEQNCRLCCVIRFCFEKIKSGRANRCVFFLYLGTPMSMFGSASFNVASSMRKYSQQILLRLSINK